MSSTMTSEYFSLIYRKFRLELLLISSSLMYFNEFCEFTGELSIGTEIEVKKHTKQSNLEKRRTKGKGQSHRRSIEHNSAIDQQEIPRSGL